MSNRIYVSISVKKVLVRKNVGDRKYADVGKNDDVIGIFSWNLKYNRGTYYILVMFGLTGFFREDFR